MKICWLTLSPAPYTLKLFNEIGKKVELVVVLYNKVENNRNSEWKIGKNNSFTLYEIDGDYDKLINKLAITCDLLIDGFYLSIFGYKAVKAFFKNKKQTVLIADGGIAKNRGIIVNKMMSLLMGKHDYYFSSSDITDKYFKYYGVSDEKIMHYRFTSLTNIDIVENAKLSGIKEKIRKELLLDDNFTIISVGQPIRRKGFDILLKAYLKTNLCENINLYIIGGKPQSEIVEYVETHKLRNVHFVELLDSNELRKYYAMSDCFVLCTREDIWGLVIEEAMSYGLPIVTSNNCVCGMHFSRVDKGPIVCDVNNIDDYATRISELFNNSKLRQAMSKAALFNIKDYSIEKSADDIIFNSNLVVNKKIEK